MTDRTLTLTGRTIAIVSLALAWTALALYVTTGNAAQMFSDWALDNILAATLAAGVAGLLVLPGQPRNGSVWAMVGTGFFGGLQSIGAATALAVAGISNADVQAGLIDVAPADIQWIAALGIDLALWAWIPGMFLMLTVVLVLFPDGVAPPPQRLWRWLPRASLVAMVIVAAWFAWIARPSGTVPYNDLPIVFDEATQTERFLIAGLLSLFVCALASVAGFIVKWRRSAYEERLRFRWLGWALVVFAFAALSLWISSDVWKVLAVLSIPAIAVAYYVAVTRNGLYEIDVVISRTIVYAVLAAFITATYVVIVVGLASMVGDSDDPSPWLAIGATAVIAIVFQPLRRWLERAANRIVYGKRATPYEVLSEFSQRVAATDDDLVSQVVESLVGGTGAETAAVWTAGVGTWQRTAVFPPDTPVGPPPDLAAHDDAAFISVPVEHDGELMGAVTLRAPQSQRLAEGDRRLALEVASGMGLALTNQQLTETLRSRVEALRVSRRRIVTVQDETRRMLERNLHDGAQQQLVALKVKLGIARQLADRDGASTSVAVLEDVSSDADVAVEEMRAFARGIYPPLLEAEGLGPAISAQARRLPVAVLMSIDGLGRYDRDRESTIYFCVMEALRNVVRHATATEAVVDLAGTAGRLSFVVEDDGNGFDAARTRWGSGFTTMSDRLDVLGGGLIIDSILGGPTRVSGWVEAR